MMKLVAICLLSLAALSAAADNAAEIAALKATVARLTELEELCSISATLIFYESGNRLAKSLADMASVLGDRPAAVARELTKLHEEVRRGSLAQLATSYGAEVAPRGEIVVVIAPPEVLPPPNEFELEVMLAERLSHLSVKDAASEVAQITKIPRKTLYGMAVRLQRNLAGEKGVDNK